jgi:hypothetical protein
MEKLTTGKAKQRAINKEISPIPILSLVSFLFKKNFENSFAINKIDTIKVKLINVSAIMTSNLTCNS